MEEIRELHVGLLNMMPDAALEATERQFYRLVGESNPIAQFYMHPFTLPALPRGAVAQAHIAEFYESFDAIREKGLDALIITGMQSDDCLRTVMNAIQDLPCINHADVSLATGEATIDHTSMVSEGDIRAAIEDAGFPTR